METAPACYNNPIMQELIKGAAQLGIELTPLQAAQFQTYFEELADWNTRVNLTAITACEEVQLKHFLDSLTVALGLPQPLPAGYRIIDVGSGGGFPGLPLKIAFPQIELVMLEATGKKAEFLRHMIDKLALGGASVLCARSEEAAQQPEYREKFDAAVTRGLAEMAVLAELTLPFCKPGGRLVAQKKGDLTAELAAGAKSIRVLGGKPAEVLPITLPQFCDNRCLVLVPKELPTPPQFPRRNGVPSRRPLG